MNYFRLLDEMNNDYNDSDIYTQRSLLDVSRQCYEKAEKKKKMLEDAGVKLVWDEDVTLDGAYLKMKFGEDKGFNLSLLGAYSAIDLQNLKMENNSRCSLTVSCSNNTLCCGQIPIFFLKLSILSNKF